MKAIVYSCKYNSLIPYFATLWNKYFSSNIPVIILSHKDIDLTQCPSNFSYYKLSNFTRSWVNDISEFFEEFEDDYFFSCMEDHFLYNNVKQDVIQEAISQFESDTSILKFGCQIGPIPQIPRWAIDTPGLIFEPYNNIFTKQCPVKQSLMPSLWRTSWFKTLLKYSKDYTAWEFELRPKTQVQYELEPEIREQIKDNNFIFYQSPEPFPCIDIVRSGQDNMRQWHPLVKPKDKSIFLNARKSVFG